MKLTFSKKNKEILIEDLHKKQFSPKEDWLIIVSIFSAIVFAVVIISAITFYNLLHKGDSNTTDLSAVEEMPIEIDRAKLNSALEFINSRKSVPSVGIEPTSTP